MRCAPRHSTGSAAAIKRRRSTCCSTPSPASCSRCAESLRQLSPALTRSGACPFGAPVGGSAYTGATVSGYQRRGAHYRPAVEVAQEERHVRTPWSLSVFAAFACTALVGVTLASPHVPSQADALAPSTHVAGQSYAINVDAVDAVTRDGFKVIKIVTAKPPPAAGIPDPGTAQAIALQMATARGWNSNEFDCLVALWKRESNWNVYSLNT